MTLIMRNNIPKVLKIQSRIPQKTLQMMANKKSPKSLKLYTE